jgi:hypothetical protein
MLSSLWERVRGLRAGAKRSAWRRRGVALATLAVTAAAAPAPGLAQAGSTGSEVTTFGQFWGYEGPLGAGIFGPDQVDTSVQSWFRAVASGSQQAYLPTDPYPGYEAPAYNGTGTGAFNFSSLPGFPRLHEGIEFWTQNGNTPPLATDINRLSFNGHITNGVTIDPVTRTSGDIRLGTITFRNGSWYSSSPTFDAGSGPLYPTSTFYFDVEAGADPWIGTPDLTNPNRHLFYGMLVLTTTLGPNTPDYLELRNALDGTASFASSVLAVDEGATGSVELWGRIGSLVPTYFANPSAGVNILSSVPVTAVPEPATVALMLAGLGVVGAAAKRRRAALLGSAA